VSASRRQGSIEGLVDRPPSSARPPSPPLSFAKTLSARLVTDLSAPGRPQSRLVATLLLHVLRFLPFLVSGHRQPARPRELGPAPAAHRLPPNVALPEAPPPGRPPVLPRPGQSVDPVAAGAGHRLSRHCRRFREYWACLSRRRSRLRGRGAERWADRERRRPGQAPALARRKPRNASHPSHTKRANTRACVSAKGASCCLGASCASAGVLPKS
jgi:hypothetical protein